MIFPIISLGISLALLLLCVTDQSLAQVDHTAIYDLNLTELSKLKVSSATKVALNSNEVPSTVKIITAEDIHRKGYLTLDEVLTDQPGFQFRDILGINSYAFQRGVPNQNNLTLLLIDGVQVNELNSGGFYGGGQYNLANVERIEIVYGPASVVYGTNAVSGVINIITKSALESRASVGALYGSFNTAAANAQYCFVNEAKSFGVSVAGMVRQSEKADLKGEAGDMNWSDKMENDETDYSFDLKLQSGDLVVGTNFLQKQTTTATLNKGRDAMYRDYGTLWNIRFVNAYVKYAYPITEAVSFSTTLYHRNTTVLDNSVYWAVDTARIGYYRPNYLTGWEGVVDVALSEAAACTGGLTVELEHLAKGASYSVSDGPEVNPPPPPEPDMARNSTISVFVEPRLRILDGLFLSGGLRFDHSSVYEQVLTPRLGASYAFGSSLLRLSYAEAFRAPKPWDYTDGRGNPSLTSERMRSFETSFSTILLKHLCVEVAGYSNLLEGAFIRQSSPSGYWWDNAGMVHTLGAEISAQYKYRDVKADVNYTYTDSRNESDAQVPEISFHMANVGFTYSLLPHLTLNLRGNFTGERPNPSLIPAENSRIIAASFLLHGTITVHDILGCDVKLSVRNLLDTKYYHSSNREPERYRQPQRTVMISATWTL